MRQLLLAEDLARSVQSKKVINRIKRKILKLLEVILEKKEK